MQIERGRMFTEGEVDRMARVGVIGPTAAKNLFGESDPVGEVIKVKGINFTVIGVSKAKGEGWVSPDDRIIVPYTTAMQILLGVTYLREIDIQTADEQDLADVQPKVTTLLRKRHRIREGADDDFQVRNMAEIRKSASEVTGLFKYLLGGIAAISLLVGGIGIMNIMLVTVTERTREIGIRKAIGAQERHILFQFLIESVIISGLGGLIGLGVGLLAAWLVPKFGPLKTNVELSSALLAIGVAAASASSSGSTRPGARRGSTPSRPCATSDAGRDKTTTDGRSAMRTIAAAVCLLLAPCPAHAADPATPGRITLSVSEAVLASLANNRALAVQQFAPAITRTGELAADAPFDTQLSGSATGSWDRSPTTEAGAYRTATTSAWSSGPPAFSPPGRPSASTSTPSAARRRRLPRLASG